MGIITFNNEFKVDSLQFCKSAEERFYNLFDENSQYYRFGSLIYNNGNLIGFLKFKGEKTVLKIPQKEEITNIMIYQLPLEFVEGIIKRIKKEKDKTWFTINFIGNLYLKKGRNLTDFEKIEKNKNEKYLRIITNSISKEYKLWKHKKDYNLIINLDEYLSEKKVA